VLLMAYNFGQAVSRGYDVVDGLGPLAGDSPLAVRFRVLRIQPHLHTTTNLLGLGDTITLSNPREGGLHLVSDSKRERLLGW
jgi:hypothetical protein